jgi:DNA-binding beta-propeller fold protein YncE
MFHPRSLFSMQKPLLAAVLALIATGGALPAKALEFEPLAVIGAQGDGSGQFRYVEDFAFTKDGGLAVTDAAHAYVQVFDPHSGAFRFRFGGKCDDDACLVKPEGIAVDAAGTFFISDYTSGQIKRYDGKGAWRGSFSGFGEAPGLTIKSEFGDIRGSRLYVPEAGNHRISVFELDGRFLFAFSGKGSGAGELNNPEAAKFGPDGRLYVTDLKNDRIQVFDADGNPLLRWGRTGTGPGEFKEPAGLAVDAKGRVYVTEIGNVRVQVFDGEGRFLTMFGRRGPEQGQFANPHGIIVSHTDGLVYVADTGNNRIQVFKPKKE